MCTQGEWEGEGGLLPGWQQLVSLQPSGTALALLAPPIYSAMLKGTEGERKAQGGAVSSFRVAMKKHANKVEHPVVSERHVSERPLVGPLTAAENPKSHSRWGNCRFTTCVGKNGTKVPPFVPGLFVKSTRLKRHVSSPRAPSQKAHTVTGHHRQINHTTLAPVGSSPHDYKRTFKHFVRH